MNIVPFSQELAQQLFESSEEFPVDFDDAWTWLGYSRKDNAKTNFLKCGFIEGVDFELLKSQELRPQGGCSNREQIKMTCDCLKQWGMMSGTAKGKEIRLYFLQCEQIAKSATHRPMSQAEIMLGMCQQLVEHEKRFSEQEKRISVLSSRVQDFESKQIAAEKAFVTAPPPEVVTPAMEVRMRINRIVRDFCFATGCEHHFAWRQLYREFRDLYHIDLSVRAKNNRHSKLDECESLGMLKDLYAVAYQLFGEIAQNG